ncbi:MAG: LmeA family phospholipid-binding protein [Armatimonadota bacterium]
MGDDIVKGGLLWLVILVGLLLAGCGTPNRLVEEAIEERAPEIIGPAQSYEADVQGISRRKIERVEIRGDGVRLRQGITLQQLTIVMTDVFYQVRPFNVTRVGHTTFTALVTEEEIHAYMQRRRDPASRVRNLQVQLTPDRVRVTGDVRTPVGLVPFTSTGHLEARNARIFYRPERIQVVGVPVPPQLNDDIAQRINPVVDLSDRPVPLQITSVQTRSEAVMIEGTAEVTAAL